MRDKQIGEHVKLALESANASARHFRTVYSFYLLFALFFLINVLITDQELLFREGQIQMPIVNVGVPVVRFFIVSPLVLLILHFNLLIQALFLSKRIALYSLELARYGGSERSNREALDSLFPIPLVFFIANSDKKKSMRWLVGTVVFISIAIVPITILIFAQIRFLPYQSETFTWIHRITVLVDIGMLCWIWPHVTLPNKSWRDGCRNIGYLYLFSAIMVLSVFVTFAFNVTGGGINRLLPEALDDGVSTFLERKFDLSDRVLVLEEPAPVLLSAHYNAECISKNGKDCDSSVIEVGSEFWCTQAKPLILNKRILRGAFLSYSILCAVKLEAADLRDADLFRANLYRANLYQANLTEAYLREAYLRDVDLYQADLIEANLVEANLRDADLRDADLTHADLYRADLRFADLRDAVLYRTDLREANLRDADLRKAKLTEANLVKANLRDADLRRANLTEADLSRADLTKADLTHADLKEADLSRADLKNANLRRANLTEAYLSRADLTKADLSRADLKNANLRRANLTEAYLRRADLTKADLFRTDLKNADLTGANLTGANLTRADLTGANLTGANLTRADLTRADLTGANLTGANLTGTDLTGANLTRADLTGADLTRADLTGADLTGAYLFNTNGVTQPQLNQACGNNTTNLKRGFRITPCG